MKNLSTRILLGTACAAALAATPALAVDIEVPNGDFQNRDNMDAGAPAPMVQSDDRYPRYNGLDGPDANATLDDYEMGHWRNWDKRHNGGELRIWNPGVQGVDETPQGLLDVGFGGFDASGDANGYVMVVRSRYLLKDLADGGTYGNSTTGATYGSNRTVLDLDTNDNGLRDDDPLDPLGGLQPAVTIVNDSGLGTGAYDSGESFRRTEGATQILSDTFDPTSRYILSAAVGRLPDTIAQGGSENYGTDKGTGGVPDGSGYDASEFAYSLGLAAGGLQEDFSLYGGWVQDGTLVAESYTGDGNDATPAINGWDTATAYYTPDPLTQAAMNALAGEAIQIRAHALADPDRQDVRWVVYDNVTLTRIVAGDTDENDKVEFTDFTTLSNNYLGAATGQDWSTGDFDGDGDVAFADFVLLSNNWGATNAAPDSAQADSDSAVNAGEAKLIVGADGSLSIEGGNVDLNGYSITSASGLLNPDGDNNSSPFTFYISNSATDVTAGNLGTFANVDGLLVLDASINPADLGNLDLVFQYGTAAGSITGDVEVVPEPTSLALLGLGGLVLTRRRRVG